MSITVPIEARLLLTAAEAAALLGMGRDRFRAQVVPEIKPVLVGSDHRYPRRELERWVERSMGR